MVADDLVDLSPLAHEHNVVFSDAPSHSLSLRSRDETSMDVHSRQVSQRRHLVDHHSEPCAVIDRGQEVLRERRLERLRTDLDHRADELAE